jgi:hypothetical protein
MIHPIIHMSLLEPYCAREGAVAPPPIVPVDGEDHWEIVRILDVDKHWGKNTVSDELEGIFAGREVINFRVKSSSFPKSSSISS